MTLCNKDFNKYKSLLKIWVTNKNKKKINKLIITLNDDKIKLFMYFLIKNNWDILELFINDKINILKSNLINNNNIFEKIILKIIIFFKKCNNIKNTFNQLYYFLNHINFIDIITFYLLIISDYNFCLLISKFNYNKINKKNLDLIIKNTKFNINYLNIILNNKIPNEKDNSFYIMLNTLDILDKYYKNPLKKIGIDFSFKNKRNFIQSKIYIIKKLKKEKLKKENINLLNKAKSYNEILKLLIKIKYNSFNSIDLIINSIYVDLKINNLPNSIIINNKITELNNNKLGIYIYILIKNKDISFRWKHYSYTF